MRKVSSDKKAIQWVSDLSASLTRNVPNEHRAGFVVGKLILSHVIKNSDKSRDSRILAKGIERDGLKDIFQAICETPETKSGKQTDGF